jgi:hypothetical protein
MQTNRLIRVIRVLLLGTSTLAIIGCDHSTPPAPESGEPASSTPAEPTPAPEAPATPVADESPDRPTYAVLTLENPIVDFGRLADFDKRRATVTFRNTGGADLRVTKVEPTCGCTSVGFDTTRIYAPGESGEITLAFTPKGQGTQTKSVRVLSNDPNVPVRLITIKADVVPSLSAEPRVLQLGRIPLGQRFETGTTLTALRPGIDLRTVTLGGDLKPYTTATIAPAGPDAQGRDTWRVDVVLDERIPWGWQTGSMVVDGVASTEEGDRPVTMNFAINGSAEGDLRATDSMLRLMVVAPGSTVEESIDLRRADGQPFRCSAAALEGDRTSGLAADVAPLDPDGRAWRVTLSGIAPTTPGSISGAVLVTTDVAGEETIAIRIGGVVRR